MARVPLQHDLYILPGFQTQGFGQSATSWRLSQVTESRALSGWLNWVQKSLLHQRRGVCEHARAYADICFRPPPPLPSPFLYYAWLLWTDKFSISLAAKERFHLFVLRYYPWCCYSNCQRDRHAGEGVNLESGWWQVVHVYVCLVPFIFQWVPPPPHLFLSIFYHSEFGSQPPASGADCGPAVSQVAGHHQPRPCCPLMSCQSTHPNHPMWHQPASRRSAPSQQSSYLAQI